MTSQLELNSRAVLCKQLAEREPAHRALWLAEAENWLRLSKGKLRVEATAFRHSGCRKPRAQDMNAKKELIMIYSLEASNAGGGIWGGGWAPSKTLRGNLIFATLQRHTACSHWGLFPLPETSSKKRDEM